MSLCPRCNTRNSYDSSFCERCGTPLSAPGRSVKVGSAPDCDVVLRAPIISGHHAAFHDLGGGRLHVVDLGSTNGVFVNGRRVASGDVNRGDRVTLGSMWLDLDFVFQALKRAASGHHPAVQNAAVAPRPALGLDVRVGDAAFLPQVLPEEPLQVPQAVRIAPVPHPAPAVPRYESPSDGPSPLRTPGSAASVGTIRHPAFVLIMGVLTLGLYSIYWYWVTLDEIRPWRGHQGWTGSMILLALVPVVGIVLIALPFLIPSYIGDMYSRAGHAAPISGASGLLVLIPLVMGGVLVPISIFGGPAVHLPMMAGFTLLSVLCGIVWVVRVQSSLNRFWELHGGAAR